MAIGAGAAGAWAATNSTTHTVTLPAHATGDLLLLIAACKTATIASLNASVTTGTGWYRIRAFADGSTASGNGTGSVYQVIFMKVATSGAETNPVITWGGGQTATPGIAVGLSFTKGGGETWQLPYVLQAATNAATSISVNMGTNPGLVAGDWGLIAHTTADDAVLTVPTWTATGTTLAAAVEYPGTAIASATSNDMAGDAAYRSVTAGPSSAAPVVTGTQATAETGVTCFIRLRVGTASPFLYLLDTVSDYATGTNNAPLAGGTSAWLSYALSSTRGGSMTNPNTSTVTGPTSGIELAISGTPRVWYSNPLDAAVTISGPILWNVWGAESNASANVAINGVLEVIDGATGTITGIDTTAHTVELATSATANNFAEVPGAGVACKRGDRLRVRVFGDDAGTMATGFTFFANVSGPTAGSSGDTFLAFTESLTFVSEPAGTTIYPTSTASDVSTASVDREAWTSRGDGLQFDTTNTAAGFTAPIQSTATAGGTVTDWFTKRLTAFTLGGAARVNAEVDESDAAANTAVRCEIARVDNDGTNATVWAATTCATESSGAAVSFLVSGDDLAITAGQRLRIRFYIDDWTGAAMVTGHTATVEYNGAFPAGAGDTYVTFTQTLTEFVPAATPARNTQISQLLAH